MTIAQCTLFMRNATTYQEWFDSKEAVLTHLSTKEYHKQIVMSGVMWNIITTFNDKYKGK